MDVGLLVVEGAVFHQVPAKNAPAGDGVPDGLIRSDAESVLDARLEAFLRDRLARTFKQAMQPVLRDPDSDSVTPDLVLNALAEVPPPDIVGPFLPLPDLLLAVQAHNSPQGLLAIIRGHCGNDRIIVLMKVEQERGLSFQTATDDGVTRVEVVIEDGLVLTDKTEVFKAALFYVQGQVLHGFVADDQSGSVLGGPSSRYWLSEFLGCKWANDVDVMTRSWIKGIKRLIKSDIADPATKSSLASALHAELTSNRANITPQSFIEAHVPLELQDRARQRLLDQGVPNRSFQKSRAVAAGAAAKTKKFEFDTDVVVIMPVGTQPDIQTIMKDDGTTEDVLTVRGQIRNVE